jgi:hypothetical protein
MTLDTVVENRRFEIAEEENPENGVVTLQPLAMRIPNSHGVYLPSKLMPKKEVSYEEFLARYAKNSVEIPVCFDEEPSEDTMVDRSQVMNAYGFSHDGWYIVDSASRFSTPSET